MDMTTTPSTLDSAHRDYIAWLRDSRDLSQHTVRAYGGDVAALVRSLGEHSTLADLNPGAIRQFFDQQRGAGISSASLRRRAAGIRSFCGFLGGRHLIASSPWPPEGLTFQRPHTLPRALPRQDLSTLLRYLMRQADVDRTIPRKQPLASPHEATTLLATALMLATGLRVSEAVSLRADDIDPSSGRIHVLGKGRRERVVYVSDSWLGRLADAYLLTRAHLGVNHSHLLFNTSLAPLATGRMRDRLARASREAGISQHVTPHMLRHSAATQLIEAGVSAAMRSCPEAAK